jgi:SAM-dependent methyltransferase
MKEETIKTIAQRCGRRRTLNVVRFINGCLKKVIFYFYRLQYVLEWQMEPTFEWFDHDLDLYYLWKVTRNPLWVERGVFNSLAIKKGGDVLELCSGDGFNARNFYSIKAKQITAVDFDPKAIRHACRHNSTDNVEFACRDIRTDLPGGPFDTVIWDAAIEHFTEDEIDIIMENIKERLRPGGILTGHTLKRKDAPVSFKYHEYEFTSKEDLMRFFTPYFKNIRVFETIYEVRHNFYFWASDGVLPFDETWQFMAQTSKTADVQNDRA